jgi:hypothetical protein
MISAPPRKCGEGASGPTAKSMMLTRYSVALGMSDRSVRRMLHMDLHFQWFRIQMVQELLPHDINMRRNFCAKLLEEMAHYRNLSQIC